MVALFQKPQLSRVNARHLLEDLASSYTYAADEAVLVEMIANALDAKAANIHIRTGAKDATLTVEDDGAGMGPEDFTRYHDLAESRKERGRGIGFAGLGAKLSHKVTRKIVTETRSQSFHAASEWYFKGDDLEWKRVGANALRHNGTRVTLQLERGWERMLTRDFLEATIRRHYAVLLDPFISEIYIWESIYSSRVTLYIDGVEVPKRRLADTDVAELHKEIDVLHGKRRVGRAVFLLAKEPLPEEQQGIALATYGKIIRLDTLGIPSREPERITGWFEAPGLVECLTTNKQDFVTAGALGEKFRRIRHELQATFARWLQEVGEAREATERERASRALELETARILRRIPQLRYLFAKVVTEPVAQPDPAGDTAAQLENTQQWIHGLEPGTGGGDGLPISPGPDEGHAPLADENGTVTVRMRPRRSRGGPHIQRVADRGRREVSWIEGDSVIINTQHPAYLAAERLHQLPYHERIAVYYALCAEAPVDAEEKLGLFNRLLTEWGKS